MSRQAAGRASQQRYSHPSLELPPYFHRLHEPRSSCIHTSGCPCLRCRDIAILFDVIVLDRRNLIIEFIHLLWDYIYCCYMMVLRQQGCYAQTDVAGTGYCYCYIFKIIHNDSVIFSKTYPSFLTVKEGVFSTSPSLLQGELHL